MGLLLIIKYVAVQGDSLPLLRSGLHHADPHHSLPLPHPRLQILLHCLPPAAAPHRRPPGPVQLELKEERASPYCALRLHDVYYQHPQLLLCHRYASSCLHGIQKICHPLCAAARTVLRGQLALQTASLLVHCRHSRGRSADRGARSHPWGVRRLFLVAGVHVAGGGVAAGVNSSESARRESKRYMVSNSGN